MDSGFDTGKRFDVPPKQVQAAFVDAVKESSGLFPAHIVHTVPERLVAIGRGIDPNHEGFVRTIRNQYAHIPGDHQPKDQFRSVSGMDFEKYPTGRRAGHRVWHIGAQLEGKRRTYATLLNESNAPDVLVPQIRVDIPEHIGANYHPNAKVLETCQFHGYQAGGDRLGLDPSPKRIEVFNNEVVYPNPGENNTSIDELKAEGEKHYEDKYGDTSVRYDVEANSIIFQRQNADGLPGITVTIPVALKIPTTPEVAEFLTAVKALESDPLTADLQNDPIIYRFDALAYAGISISR